MTDNNGTEDLAHVEMGAEETTAQPGLKHKVLEAWRTKPLVKLIIIIVAVGAVVGVGSNFLAPEKETPAQARVVVPPEMHEAPGGKVSPYMKKQTDLANQQRADQAMKSNDSALPTPQGLVTDLGDLEKKNDPLTELKAETEHLKEELVQVKQAQKQAVILPQATVSKPEPPDDNLAQAMQRQMTTVLEDWKVRGIKSVNVSDMKEINAEHSQSTGASSENNMADATSPTNKAKIIVPAGTVNYAQLLTEANSDVPGPIMVEIVSGPFSGSRAIGNFTTKNDYLVLQFSLVHFKGKDYRINAIALDPDTTLAGMATEVDERYFTRVVLPAGAAFLQGLGSALSQNTQTVVENGNTTLVTQSSRGIHQGIYDGLGAAANTAGQFFQNQANKTNPLVRVASGTPLGLFFVESVFDTQLITDTPPQKQNGYTQVGLPMQGLGFTPPMSLPPIGAAAAYMGQTVNGYGGQSSTNNGPYNSQGSGNIYGGNTGTSNYTGGQPNYNPFGQNNYGR